MTLFGYGIRVNVHRGHLLVEDGIGVPRRKARFARVGHGLRRLIVIGSDGMVSLAALRWLADQKAAFVMLDRDGSVLVATGPVGPSDARLRRAQALAHHTGIAVPIIRELIDRKLAGHEHVATILLRDSVLTEAIASARDALRQAGTPAAIRQIEAQAALAYWTAWRAVPVLFPRTDLPRVPDHWRMFGARRSPISNSPRVASNPPNAILNYLFAILEAETRLSVAALGLDPGLGLLHVDTDARDSLALDVMEVVRPDVEAYALQWLLREPLHRGWFFEERTGHCRLTGEFAVKLGETAPTWRRAIAPVAEWIASTLWSTVRKSGHRPRLPTLLTQETRRAARGLPSKPVGAPPRPPRVCRGCGAPVQSADRRFCKACGITFATEALIGGAVKGRAAAQSPEAQSRRAAALARNRAAEHIWNQADQPSWLTETIYSERIQPALTSIKISTLTSALGVSKPYAVRIRAGRARPHPRHWLTLAGLAGVSADE